MSAEVVALLRAIRSPRWLDAAPATSKANQGRFLADRLKLSESGVYRVAGCTAVLRGRGYEACA